MTSKKIRITLLFAGSLTSGACAAENQPSESSSPSNRDTQVTRPGEGTPARNLTAATGPDVTLERIIIASDAGQMTAELADNEATRRLVQMLPLTIEMRDHLRQEKTGDLPSPLPESPRQIAFSAGTLGLWGSDDFVIYYRDGSVPTPGIVVLGRVTGDVSVFDRPGPVSVRIQRAEGATR